MNRVLRVLAVVLGLTGVLWHFTFGSFHQEIRYSAPSKGPLPEFTLPVLNGALFEGDTTFLESGDLKGKVVLLAFWATWCAPCLLEQPSLLALQEEFEKDGLRVLGVLHRDDPAKALMWLRAEERIDLKTVVSTPEYSEAVRVGSLPHTLLVDGNGEVLEVFGWYGDDLEPYMKRRVREELRRLDKGGR